MVGGQRVSKKPSQTPKPSDTNEANSSGAPEGSSVEQGAESPPEDSVSLTRIYEELRAFREGSVKEIQDFRRSTEKHFDEIKADLQSVTTRMTEAESRITTAEERVQCLEDANAEVLKLLYRFCHFPVQNGEVSGH